MPLWTLIVLLGLIPVFQDPREKNSLSTEAISIFLKMFPRAPTKWETLALIERVPIPVEDFIIRNDYLLGWNAAAALSMDAF